MKTLTIGRLEKLISNKYRREDESPFNTLEIPEGYTHISPSKYGNVSTNLAMRGIETLILPSTIVSIDSRAFQYCNTLKNVRINNNSNGESELTHIGEYAFDGCHNLEKFLIPRSVTHIGRSVFQDCNNIKRIDIFGKIDNIYKRTFAHCEQMTELNIYNPSPNINMDISAFTGLGSLKTVFTTEEVLPKLVSVLINNHIYKYLNFDGLTISTSESKMLITVNRYI